MKLDKRFRSTDQSTDMTLKANRESSIETVSPKKPIWDGNPKDFTREPAQTINLFDTESTVIIKSMNFDFTDSKIEKQFNYE